MKRILATVLAAALAGTAFSAINASAAAIASGDVNNDGVVDDYDSYSILKSEVLLMVKSGKNNTPVEDYVKYGLLTEEQAQAADVNKDGRVDTQDVSNIIVYENAVHYGYTKPLEASTVDELKAFCNEKASKEDLKKLDSKHSANAIKYAEVFGDANIVGDTNKDGKLTAEDATEILITSAQKAVNGNMDSTEADFRCDANIDGEVTAEDATLVLTEFADSLIS